MIFKLKKKSGRYIYFRACSTDEEPADDLLIKLFFFFPKEMEKNLPRALCVELCEAILHANSCHLIQPRCPSWPTSSWKLYAMTLPQLLAVLEVEEGGVETHGRDGRLIKQECKCSCNGCAGGVGVTKRGLSPSVHPPPQPPN